MVLKLPPSWSEQPKAWFAQTEAQFILNNITSSETKFYLVSKTQAQETLNSVLDIVHSPPPENPYETLKARLVQSFALSTYQRAEQTANLPPLGDRRPSQLMNSRLALLPDGYNSCSLFNFLSLQRMPAVIRGLLVSQRIKEPRELAARADEYWVVRQWIPPIASVGPTLPEQPVVPDDGISALRNQSTYRRNFRSDRPPLTNENSICWHHRK